MKRKILSTILAILGISIIGIAILFFLGLFKEQEAGILIESDPISKIYINGVEVGVTPYESNRKSGEVRVKIKPEQLGDQIFDDYETKINLIPGVKTIIKRTFKFSDENTSGIVVSFEKIGGDQAFVTAVSIPDNAQILIDGKNYGFTPLRIKVQAGDHTLSILSDKYLEKTLPIKVYKGYKLTASVKLAKIEEQQQQQVVLSESIVNLNSIRINKTDIGFLRVRSGANTGFPEVGQVKPDEVYEVIEEGENGKWYKIKFLNSDGNEIEGWVSAEFVTKI
ncbi:MAG: hypothetical protein ACD_19C00016G0010 [uncultured bacterium]|nr:MAG: hypothetical protein ACD_19C00016G0010 [uncultured bacterium]